MTHETLFRVWDDVEKELIRTLRHIRYQNIELVEAFFQELHDRAFSVLLIPRTTHAVVWLERGDSSMIMRFASNDGFMHVEACIKAKRYILPVHEIAMTSEVQALLDLLIAQPEEGQEA